MTIQSMLSIRTLNYWQASRWLRGHGGPNWLRPVIAAGALREMGRHGDRIAAAARTAMADTAGTTARLVTRNEPPGAA